MNTLTLIADAQAGDREAAETLFGVIIKEHMPPRVARKLGRNVLVDAADIESDFLMGCLKALPKVKIDVGNPLLFILWKGDLAVAALFKQRLQHGVTASCHACGKKARVAFKNRVATCRHCGSTDVDTQMIQGTEEDLVRKDPRTNKQVMTDRTAEMDAIFFLGTQNVQIEEMRSRLRGRVRELFDIIVFEEINRETSKNYLKEIAERWGVTTAAVSVYLRKLRIEITAYLSGE